MDYLMYRLQSMTELERETILADRRRKLDLLQEHRELKARIGQKLGRRAFFNHKRVSCARIREKRPGFYKIQKGKRIG